MENLQAMSRIRAKKRFLPGIILRAALSTAFILVSVTAAAQDHRSIVLAKAENIMNLLPGQTLETLNSYAYLWPTSNIAVTGEVGPTMSIGSTIIKIEPGARVLSFCHQLNAQPNKILRQTSAGTAFEVKSDRGLSPSSNSIELALLFEAGKLYGITFNTVKKKGLFKADSLASVGIVEMFEEFEDEAGFNPIVLVRHYLTWTRDHAGELDGTYKTSNGKKWIKFEGNTFVLHSPYAGIGNKITYEGIFWFDGEVIILQPHTSTITSKPTKLNKEKIHERKITSMECGYYEFTDGILDILAVRGGLSPSFGGQYFKSDE